MAEDNAGEAAALEAAVEEDAGVSDALEEAGGPRPPNRLLSAFATGFEVVAGHYEYTFQVRHASGCAWRIQRRFSELATFHGELSEAFNELPEFPDSGFPGLNFMLGQEVAVRRTVGLQRYIEALLEREDVVCSPLLQRALEVRAPRRDGVKAVRAKRWRLAPQGSPAHGTATVELEVTFHEEVNRDGVAPIDRVLLTAAAGGALVELNVAAGELLCVEGLPCGERATFEVSAANALGESDSFVVCLPVPAHGDGVLGPGTRVRAVWAGDGNLYDAVVSVMNSDGESVVLDWMRPAPLSDETLDCVCQAGGDDATHRVVPLSLVTPLAEIDLQKATPPGAPVDDTASDVLEGAPSAALADDVSNALEVGPAAPNSSVARGVAEVAAVSPFSREVSPLTPTGGADTGRRDDAADGHASPLIDTVSAATPFFSQSVPETGSEGYLVVAPAAVVDAGPDELPLPLGHTYTEGSSETPPLAEVGASAWSASRGASPASDYRVDEADEAAAPG